jgi:hypothetical protein
MRPLRALSAIPLSLGLLAAPASAVAMTGSESAPLAGTSTWVVIHTFPHNQLFGQLFTISGQVRFQQGGSTYALQNAGVVLLRRPAGSSVWTTIASGRTNAANKPTYAFTVRARENSRYRVRFVGSRGYAPAHANVKVSVHRRLPSRLRQITASRLRLVGHVVPTWSGRRVRLFQRGCRHCAWRPLRSELTSSRSRFRFRVGAPRSGYWYFQVRVHGTTAFAPSVSATYRTYRL